MSSTLGRKPPSEAEHRRADSPSLAAAMYLIPDVLHLVCEKAHPDLSKMNVLPFGFSLAAGAVRQK